MILRSIISGYGLYVLCLSCVPDKVLAAESAPPLQAELLQVHKIWDQAPHNAFTDLIRFRDRWWCTFREGQGHVSPDGAVRLISSADSQSWTSAARLESAEADLRDPKLSRTPNGQLMITAAAAWHQPNPASHQTMAWFSRDGVDWSDPVPIGRAACESC